MAGNETEKWSKVLHRHFTNKNTQEANKHMEDNQLQKSSRKS